MTSARAYVDVDMVAMMSAGDPTALGACEARGSILPKLWAVCEGVWNL